MDSIKKSFHELTKIKQVCISGASGFVGSRLLEKLIKEGFLVRVLTRNSNRSFTKGVEVWQGDLTSSTCDLKGFFSGCDVFFHCAGDIKNPKNMRALHIHGTSRLIDAFNEEINLTGKNIHWVQLSSVGVYKKNLDKPSGILEITENSFIDPSGEYEITKAEADQLLLVAAASGGFTYSILRPSAIVGIDMPNKSFGSLIFNITKRNFFYIGSDNSISNYVHVDDVVDLLVISAKSENAVNEIFNLSNDCKLSEIVSSISLSGGISVRKFIIPEWFVRLIVSLMPAFFQFPLTKSRIDALVSKTHYPSSKAKFLLEFLPKKSIPIFAVEYFEHIKAKNEK